VKTRKPFSKKFLSNDSGVINAEASVAPANRAVRSKARGKFAKFKKLMNKYISARFYLAIGLVSLLVSTLLGAIYFDFVPDRSTVQKEARATIAEMSALTLIPAVATGNVQDLQATLRFIASRSQQIESMAVRQSDGTLIAQVNSHSLLWKPTSSEHSIDSQVVVPLTTEGTNWGQIELLFKPAADNRMWLVLGIALSCFCSFYFYLGKMLRHLDPSKAVPERVRNALDTLAEGLLVVDVEGNIVLANQAFASHVGIDAEKLTGRLIDTFQWCDATGVQAIDLPWTDCLDEGIAKNGAHVSLPSASGKRHSFMVNCSPVVGGNKKHNGMLMSLSDITLIEEKEAELVESKKAADAANQAKSDFLANMSHEIRTPMNAVLGFTELLRRGQIRDDKEAKKHLNTIHSNGKHLLELINDILDLSKVEAGRLEIEKISIQPHRIIAEVVQVLQVKATEKGIGLKFVCNGMVPPTVQTDPARLRQVITNLVGNAIKFTEHGQVSIVQRMINDGNHTKLAISIVDSGVGIPADKVDSIFEAFVQAESSTTRRFGGTGLGLSISKKFAHALGGDILVKSEFGKGSSFTLTLDPGVVDPRSLVRGETLDLNVEAVVDNRTHRWQFAGQRVLVVDDGQENRELVRLVLEEVGLKVDEAENGQVAVDKVQLHSYSIVLMDMQMPVLDGYEATKTLRKLGCQLPIVALTAHAMAGFEAKILAVGCSAYLTKPIDIDRLLQHLAKDLNAVQVPIDVATPVFQLGANKSAGREGADQADNTPVVSRLAGHPKLGAVARTFGLKLPGEVIKMQAALKSLSFVELSELAHWLKGAAGSVGYDVFTEPAQQLERAAKTMDSQLASEMLLVVASMATRVVLPETVAPILAAPEKKLHEAGAVS
jgi:PAS domain S-box-containing protein